MGTKGAPRNSMAASHVFDIQKKKKKKVTRYLVDACLPNTHFHPHIDSTKLFVQSKDLKLLL